MNTSLDGLGCLDEVGVGRGWIRLGGGREVVGEGQVPQVVEDGPSAAVAVLALDARAHHFADGGHVVVVRVEGRRLFRRGEIPAVRKGLYRVTLVVEYLGWVDLDLGCSTILLGQ